jgi:NAD(P)-dependent dehydrogenase (short-subunit alcohol dehydrogenase family)
MISQRTLGKGAVVPEAKPLDGRVAVVSGGGKRLGRSFCLALARQGARVVVNNRNRAAGAAALERWGRLDICVANAAIGTGGMFHKQPAGRLRRASVVEWDTVFLPNEPDLRPGQLQALLAKSGSGPPREFRVAVDAFNDLVSGGPD